MDRILEPEAMDTAEEAESYDRMDHSEANTAFVERLLELGASGRMLDIGTGPAHIPLILCRKLDGARIVAVDLAQHMLRVARGNVEGAGLADRIELHHGDAKGLAFPDASFDAVYSNTILHHIPDPVPFLSEAARVLRRGGALLIRDLYRPPDEARVRELVGLHAAECDEYQQGLFAASLRAAFTPRELARLAADSGLEGAEVVVDTDRHMSLQIRAVE